MYSEIKDSINNLSLSIDSEQEQELKNSLHSTLNKIANNDYIRDEAEDLIFSDDDVTDFYELDESDIEVIREIQHNILNSFAE